MKYFKHYVDAHRGRSMQLLFSELGHEGLACWWILVEICAEKLEKRRDERFTEDDCRFVLNERFLRQNWRVSSAKVERILNQCSTLVLLSFEKRGCEIYIHMPKLLESLDRDSMRARPRRAVAEPRIEEYKNRRREEAIAPKTATALPPLVELWNQNCGNLGRVVKTNSSRNRKIQILWPQCSPDEWVQVIKKIAASDFCNGKNDKGWRATFDWLLQSDTHLKVSEGKFDNRKNKQIGLVAD